MPDTDNFDADSFLLNETDNATSTVNLKIPEEDYETLITKVSAKAVNRKDGTTAIVLELTHQLLKEELKEQIGWPAERDLTARQSIWLDVDDDFNILIGEGINVGLGHVREAVGQNVAGEQWNFKMLEGAGPMLSRLRHGENKDDPENPYMNIVRVQKLS